MQLLKIGDRFINIDSVRSWSVRKQTGGTDGDVGRYVPDGQSYDVVDIAYVGGGTETLYHEEATALRHWLHATAQDVMAPRAEAFGAHLHDRRRPLANGDDRPDA